MNCPVCTLGDFSVIDSRPNGASLPVRRRRRCAKCGYKAHTIEDLDAVTDPKALDRLATAIEEAARAVNAALLQSRAIVRARELAAGRQQEHAESERSRKFKANGRRALKKKPR